ncbi:hypothetical protein EDB81DRAFT_665027, partial [Dactylonectria macrodidyma]
DEAFQQTTLTRRSQLRPAGTGLLIVPYTDWRPALPYNEQPPDYIRYYVEWKLSVNNRQKSGESELGVVISPRKFWKHVLRSKLQAAVEKSLKPWEPAEMKIILSVTDRKTSSITKRFPKLDIQWSYAAE